MDKFWNWPHVARRTCFDHMLGEAVALTWHPSLKRCISIDTLASQVHIMLECDEQIV